MAEQLTKLRPDRDLQCYFQEPSTVAALSETSAIGFTVSGTWRQQFDWAVVEWNRDNVFEHPALRNLPDGNLNGITLSYEEVRTNCLPFDSTVFDSVDWSYLRLWEEHVGSTETFHEIPLKNYATPVDGEYVSATATFDLQGTPTAGDLIELAWLDDHSNYEIASGDTLESALAGLVTFINNRHATGGVVSASSTGTQITLTYTGSPGTNGNRVGIYGGVHGADTESWSPSSAMFSGGVSPLRWRVDLDFANLRNRHGQLVITTNVRRLRWTWAADLQPANFGRSEFSVVVRNWQATGTNLLYSFAGPGSRRIEDDSSEVTYSGSWVEERGNYSGGSIRHTETVGDHVTCTYSTPATHTLYMGTRYLDPAPLALVRATVVVDGGTPILLDLTRGGEDVLIRHSLGQLSASTLHTVTITHSGTPDTSLYFDFLEIAVPSTDLPDFDESPATTLATDWDTNHSLAIAPERTAWLMDKLGFKGRANHYAGAMWFYELWSPDSQYASATVEFSGTPQFADITSITLATLTVIQHVNLTTDTPESIAKCFEFLISGSSAVWAHAEGAVLTITSRAIGTAGNSITISASNSSGAFTATASGTTFSGGVGATANLDTAWRTDLTATPRLNRAVRDWSRSYYRALQSYGIDVAAAFSMELRHGDSSETTGIAQRYPNAGPVLLNTPAIQTNFSPVSTAFWKEIYLDMADVMAEAGIVPYLQFGEVQWWYKPDNHTGMPFYDDYTKAQFLAAYGEPIGVITDQFADPASFPRECVLLPSLIGQFTQAVMDFVRLSYSAARFEVLYPPDVNDTPLNRLINYPLTDWTAAKLTCLKTENFLYTGDRNLNKARESIDLPAVRGFPPSQSSHLIGIGEYTTPWARERRLAMAAGVESVVLFALDQLCLIGYTLPLDRRRGRAHFMGK